MMRIPFFLFGLLIFSQAQAQTDPWPWVEDGADVTSILLMGDNNFQFRKKPEEAFKYVQPTLLAADLRFLNLEGPFAGASKDPRVPDIPHKNWRHSEPDQVAALVAADIDVVGVANNVTYPWQALLRSLEVLDKAGIAYTSGGNNIAEAHRPVILEKNGLRVGFIQYCASVFPYNHAATEQIPGIAQIKVHTAYQAPHNLDKPGQPPIVITWLDEESKALMVQDIIDLNKKADIVVASYHWGISRSTETVSYQSDIGKAVIDAGADVVIGHGPHKYQKIEVYKGKPIFHSLAQFAFDDRRKDRYKIFKEGLLVCVAVKNKRVESVSFVPSWREDDNFVRLYDPNTGKGRELFGYLQSVNEGGADLKIVGKEIVVHLVFIFFKFFFEAGDVAG